MSSNTKGLADETGHEELSRLLKRCRLRIPKERRTLGTFTRSAARIGHRVTQSEIAQAAGISRQWYLFLENNRAVRVSPDVLRRIADVLMMTAAERTSLFRLAVPELRSIATEQPSMPALDAIVPFRDLMRNLRTANTKAEALKMAREYAVKTFAPDAVTTSMNVTENDCDYAFSGIEHERASELKAVLQRHDNAPSGDEGYVSGRLRAGDRRELSFAKVPIPSRAGQRTSLMLFRYGLKEFTIHERAQLLALAGIVSLALPA